MESFKSLPFEKQYELWRKWNPSCTNGLHCSNHNPRAYNQNLSREEMLKIWIEDNPELLKEQIRNSGLPPKSGIMKEINSTESTSEKLDEISLDSPKETSEETEVINTDQHIEFINSFNQNIIYIVKYLLYILAVIFYIAITITIRYLIGC